MAADDGGDGGAEFTEVLINTLRCAGGANHALALQAVQDGRYRIPLFVRQVQIGVRLNGCFRELCDLSATFLDLQPTPFPQSVNRADSTIGGRRQFVDGQGVSSRQKGLNDRQLFGR